MVSTAVCAAISLSAAIGVGYVVATLSVHLIQLLETSFLMKWNLTGKNYEHLTPPVYFGFFTTAFSVVLVGCFSWLYSLCSTIAEIEKRLTSGYGRDDYDLILEVSKNGQKVKQYHLRLDVVDVVEPGQSREIKGTVWNRLKNFHHYLENFLDDFRKVQFSPLGMKVKRPQRTKKIPLTDEALRGEGRRLSRSSSSTESVDKDILEQSFGSSAGQSQEEVFAPIDKPSTAPRSAKGQTGINIPLMQIRRSDRIRTKSCSDLQK